MMENTDQYTISSTERPEKQEYHLTPSESAFFSQLEKSLKKGAADMTSPRPLETLCENMHRLKRLF